jgi:hypothetical protein
LQKFAQYVFGCDKFCSKHVVFVIDLRKEPGEISIGTLLLLLQCWQACSSAQRKSMGLRLEQFYIKNKVEGFSIIQKFLDARALWVAPGPVQQQSDPAPPSAELPHSGPRTPRHVPVLVTSPDTLRMCPVTDHAAESADTTATPEALAIMGALEATHHIQGAMINPAIMEELKGECGVLSSQAFYDLPRDSNGIITNMFQTGRFGPTAAMFFLCPLWREWSKVHYGDLFNKQFDQYKNKDGKPYELIIDEQMRQWAAVYGGNDDREEHAVMTIMMGERIIDYRY